MIYDTFSFQLKYKQINYNLGISTIMFINFGTFYSDSVMNNNTNNIIYNILYL